MVLFLLSVLGIYAAVVLLYLMPACRCTSPSLCRFWTGFLLHNVIFLLGVATAWYVVPRLSHLLLLVVIVWDYTCTFLEVVTWWFCQL